MDTMVKHFIVNTYVAKENAFKNLAAEGYTKITAERLTDALGNLTERFAITATNKVEIHGLIGGHYPQDL